MELLGVPEVALIGRSVGDVVHADDRQSVLTWLSGAGPDGETAGTLACRLDTGEAAQRWVEATLTDLSADPAVGGLMLRLRDITERRRLEQALEELAATDSLTGVANRRRFDQTLRSEAERCLRSGGPLTLLMLDIDHFKSVNDTYGHPAGDAMLQAVASECRSAVRDIDLVARIGGEEFGILLVNVDLAEGERVAERIRKLIEALQLDVGERSLSCTASIGLAGFTGSALDLMTQADAALYRAKEGGRNQVHTAH
jgi:diguanylate cyclase (GGDEF)-like protein/PAS domain S-box-containing protein